MQYTTSKESYMREIHLQVDKTTIGEFYTAAAKAQKNPTLL